MSVAPTRSEANSLQLVGMTTQPVSYSSQPDDDEDESLGTDYIRAVVLNQCKDHVLMIHNEKGWDLPLLVYKGMLENKVHLFCKNVQSALAMHSDRDTDFITVFELLGSYASAENLDVHAPKYLKLMVVEYRHSQEDLDSKLPPHTEWKNFTFLSKLRESTENVDEKISFEEVASLLQSRGERLLSLREPRHHFGWFKRASDVFFDVAKRFDQGAVKTIVQFLMGPNATVLRAECEKGDLFLKSPLPLSNEATITRKIGELFPGSAPQVLEINEELNLFVTRDFQDFELSETDIPGVCLEAGRLQLSSLKCLGELEASGCKLRGPGELKQKVTGWLRDPLVRRALGGRNLHKLQTIIESVEKHCDELSRSTVPMTLVHGDMYVHNATKRVPEEGYMLFDYEFAYIGHPFCEMHTVYKEMTEEGIDNYLQLWSKCGTLEELRKTLGIACKVGWCVRLWKVFDDIAVCDARKFNELYDYAEDIFYIMYEAMSENDIS